MPIDTATLRAKFDTSEILAGKKDLDGLSTSAEGAEKKVGGLTRGAAALGTALGGISAGLVAREVIQLTDAWQRAENQLRLVTNTTDELTAIQDQLMRVANETRSSFDATANLYTKLARSTQEMGLSQRELVDITQTINQSFAASGATADEASGAIRQLGQALASGALRGDEFNSIAEQAPGIMRAIADSLGKTIGELRDFAAEGGITAQIVVEALQGASDSIANDFGQSIATFGDKMQIAQNNLLEFVGSAEASRGTVGLFGDAVVLASENLDLLAIAASSAAAALSVRLLPAVTGLTGPLGVLVGVLTGGTLALREFGQAAEEEMREAWKTASIKQYQEQIQGVGQRLKTLNELMAENPQRTGAQIRAYEAMRREADLLEDQIAGMVARVRESIQVHRDTTVPIQEQGDAIDELGESYKVTHGFITDFDDALMDSGSAANEVAVNVSDLVSENFSLLEQYRVLPGVASQSAEGVRKIQTPVEQLNDELRVQINLVENTQREWANLINDVFTGGASDIGDFFDVIAKGAARAVAEIIAMKAAIGIFGGSGGGINIGGAGGSIAGNVLGGAAGSILSGGGLGQFVGGLFGNAVGTGSAIAGPPTAAAAAGSGLADFLTNPWTLGLGALAIGASNGFWSDPDNYQRSNAGFLAAPTPGADPSRLFNVAPFASGFQPIGFNRRASQGDALGIINQFGAVDSRITELSRQLGFSVDLSGSTLGGVGQDGRYGTNGTFFGMGGQTQNLQLQIDEFARQISRLIAAQNGMTDAIQGLDLTTATASEIIEFLEAAVDANTAAEQENTAATAENSTATRAASSISLGGLMGPSFATSGSFGIGSSLGGQRARSLLPGHDPSGGEISGGSAWRNSRAFRRHQLGISAGGNGIIDPLSGQYAPAGPGPGLRVDDFDATPRDLTGFYIPGHIQTAISSIGNLAFNDLSGARSGLAVAQSAANLRDYQQFYDAGYGTAWTPQLQADLERVYNYNMRNVTGVEDPASGRGQFISEQQAFYEAFNQRQEMTAQNVEIIDLLQQLVDQGRRIGVSGVLVNA